MMDYEKLARDAGYEVVRHGFKAFYWTGPEYEQSFYEGTEHDAWKACCVENGLLEEK